LTRNKTKTTTVVGVFVSIWVFSPRKNRIPMLDLKNINKYNHWQLSVF